MEVLVGSVRLEEGESGEEFNLGFLSDLFSVVEILRNSLVSIGPTEVGNFGLDLGSDMFHAVVVVGNGVHLRHGLDRGGDEGLELDVGGGGSSCDLRPVLGHGVFAGEDEGGSSHTDGRWEGGGLHVGHQVGQDGGADEASGHGIAGNKGGC